MTPGRNGFCAEKITRKHPAFWEYPKEMGEDVSNGK